MGVLLSPGAWATGNLIWVSDYLIWSRRKRQGVRAVCLPLAIFQQRPPHFLRTRKPVARLFCQSSMNDFRQLLWDIRAARLKRDRFVL
jgi:hypothetical protein